MNSPQIQHLNNLSCKILFSTGYHCQFLDVCQGMKQISTIYQEYVNFGSLRSLYSILFNRDSWNHHFERFAIAIIAWLTVRECIGHRCIWICSDCWSQITSFPRFLQRSPLFFLDVGHFSKYNFDSCLIVPQFFRYFF
jgi:hypothetical protein